MPRRKKPTTIKEVRVSQNLSQAEFAKAIGVSTPSVSAYETGRVNLPQKVADKVFELYGISLSVPEQKKIKKPDAPKKVSALYKHVVHALHYDVFISHANSDKEEYVNCLKASIDQLNVNVFYDKDTFVWGDNWKKKLLEGINAAEFAIVVISENYFGREWTEKELNDFFERQNSIGQKIILPILHNISIHQLKEHYPHIANIQAIESSKYSCDQIALLFARLLIERIRSNNSTVSSEKRMDFHPSDPEYTSRLKKAYHSLIDFRDAINRADQEIINQKSIILTQSFQELYNFFEFYSEDSNTNAVHVRFVQEIVAQYNVSVNSLHSFLAGSRDVNSLQHTNDELKKLLNLIIKALQEEGEKL